MYRRKYIAIAGSAVPLGSGIVGASDGQGEEKATGNETEEQEVMEVADDELYSISNPDDIGRLPFELEAVTEFEGEGSTVTDEFELEGRMAMLVYENENMDDSEFLVHVENTDGDDDRDYVVDEWGFVDEEVEEFTGGRVFGVEGGEYLLEIDASDAWRVHVVQPQSPEEEVRSTPAHVEGEHSAVVGPLNVDNGVTVAAAQNNEDHFFSVFIAEEDAAGFAGADYVFDEEGGFEGEARADVDGVSWLHVVTRGEWALEFE